MVKASVMYLYSPGARFDHEYYRDKHMPMVKARMGAACKSYTIEKGLAGEPGSPPVYVAIGSLFSDSLETFQAGIGPHLDEILADIPSYTNATWVMQISEVVVG
jgi:uncharacterized protein (TIGR02118 family)